MKPLAAVVLISTVACNDSQARPAAAEQAAATAAVEPERSAELAGHSDNALVLRQIGPRFRSPVYLASPPGDSRLFIVEQAGRIRVMKEGSVVSAPFLDISERVQSGGEQGLLSMAFHPDYRTNGWFFVNFTDLKGDTHVERFKVSANPDVADEGTAKVIIAIDQPYSNHNGGHILFGPDGMLYIGMGDGGSGGDPHRNGQNRSALLGKMLRINVSGAEPYSIPAGNPYVNTAGGRPEIWATGLRNPWRFAFDRGAGLLYVADVGQSSLEEIHVVPAGEAGINYGWNIMEGTECFRGSGCNRSGLNMPAVTYGRSGGACSVTGGFVYRGRRIPQLAGQYFYSDYCAGFVRSFRYQDGRATDARQWKTDDIGNVVSFGEDSEGELYIVGEGGRVWRMDGTRTR